MVVTQSRIGTNMMGNIHPYIVGMTLLLYGFVKKTTLDCSTFEAQPPCLN